MKPKEKRPLAKTMLNVLTNEFGRKNETTRKKKKGKMNKTNCQRQTEQLK